jgi:ABC-type multidrug transport system fused ATPase/permease subunit
MKSFLPLLAVYTCVTFLAFVPPIILKELIECLTLSLASDSVSSELIKRGYTMCALLIASKVLNLILETQCGHLKTHTSQKLRGIISNEMYSKLLKVIPNPQARAYLL